MLVAPIAFLAAAAILAIACTVRLSTLQSVQAWARQQINNLPRGPRTRDNPGPRAKGTVALQGRLDRLEKKVQKKETVASRPDAKPTPRAPFKLLRSKGSKQREQSDTNSTMEEQRVRAAR